ncbi:MAG: HlyC/CorC family transporter [Ignavibacteriales bacterium]|nr:HlyC/CorC family transporter [Ignavibacteriales bacterium]
MDISPLSHISVLIICLILSAFFSASETAFFSLDKKRIKELEKDYKIIGGYVQLLLDDTRRFIITLTIGKTLANTAAAIVSVMLAINYAAVIHISIEIALLIQIFLLTTVVLIFCEIYPKKIAEKYPESFVRVSVIPLRWINILFSPFTLMLIGSIKFFSNKLKLIKRKNGTVTSEISELTEFASDDEKIKENEQELIRGIVDFKNVTAREIMTPRVDIAAVDIDVDFETLMKIITESGHSRIPLYENNLDNIIGIIFAKDLLPILRNPELKKSLQIRTLAREAMFVPGTKLIIDLLHEFQDKKMHLGIVVDEYGGTAGLISLEDILEEIVGDIRDEYDKDEMQFTKLSEESFLLKGKVPIDKLNELLDADFSSEHDDYDTVGGFIFHRAGMIPNQGFHFISNNYKFTVKEVINKRISKVLVEKQPPGKTSL